jgi:hypothetical protein
MIRVVVWLVLLVGATTGHAATVKPACDNARAVWANEKDSVRQVIYGSDGLNYGSTIYLEEWRDGKLAWRANGRTTCSNGASICYAMFEDMSGKTGDDALTSAVIESVDADEDGVDDWIILAAAAQTFYYSAGLKVTWYNDFDNPNEERILPRNVFKLLSCRNAKEVVLFEPPKTDVDELTGALYASPDVCDQYRSTGALTPTKPGTNDGPWWMDDRKIVGHEMDCKIISFSTDTLRARCELDGETTVENYPFRTKGKTREIMSQKLQLCNRID